MRKSFSCLFFGGGGGVIFAKSDSCASQPSTYLQRTKAVVSFLLFHEHFSYAGRFHKVAPSNALSQTFKSTSKAPPREGMKWVQKKRRRNTTQNTKRLSIKMTLKLLIGSWFVFNLFVTVCVLILMRFSGFAMDSIRISYIISILVDKITSI